MTPDLFSRILIRSLCLALGVLLQRFAGCSRMFLSCFWFQGDSLVFPMSQHEKGVTGPQGPDGEDVSHCHILLFDKTNGPPQFLCSDSLFVSQGLNGDPGDPGLPGLPGPPGLPVCFRSKAVKLYFNVFSALIHWHELLSLCKFRDIQGFQGYKEKRFVCYNKLNSSARVLQVDIILNC